MTTLVEVYRSIFPSRAVAGLAATTARSLGFEVELRDAGGGRVLVVVEALRSK